MHDVIPHWLDNAPFSGSSTRAGRADSSFDQFAHSFTARS